MVPVFSAFTWTINLLVQNVDKMLFLVNVEISDVIYHPRACKMISNFFPHSRYPCSYTILFFDIVRNDKHYTDSWLFK